MTQKTDAIREALINEDINVDSKICVDVFRGPAGAYGFRKGMFPVKIGDVQFRVYSCVPHSCELDEQREMIVGQVHQFLSHALETYERDGKRFYRYMSQSERA